MISMTSKTLFLFALAAAMVPIGETRGQEKPLGPVQFTKVQIASESYESVGVFDVNGDRIPDLVSGAYWYEGPNFIRKHYIGPVKPYGEYWDDFSNIPLDVNGDGRMDYVTGSWFSNSVRWHENPGDDQEWKQHIIGETGNVEGTMGWDIDGDGHIEIVPNTPGHPLRFFKLLRDGTGRSTGRFQEVVVAANQGHGLGFGDVNGDGRGDFVISNGWLEAPKDPLTGKWILHEEFDFGGASLPILLVDVNQDGKMDIIVGQGHDYGLDWYEQTVDSKGNRAWIKHPIDPFNSQYHTMQWVDLDGDGQGELLTGKRYRAHNGGDPGADDLLGLYYFKWNGESFSKQVISYGPLGVGKGAGLSFSTADLRNTGRLDIVVAGKDGLYVFYNQGTTP